MDKERETMLIDYLQRQIRSSNSILREKISYGTIFTLRGSVKDKHHSISEGYSAILDTFAGKDQDKLEIIRRDREKKINEHYGYFNYFDLNTLVAYNIYLKQLKATTYEFTRKRAGAFVSLKDLENGIKATQEFMTKNAGKRESGFYSPDSPITLATNVDENGNVVLSPRAVLSDTTFNNKYDVFECFKDYNRYLDELERGGADLEEEPTN